MLKLQFKDRRQEAVWLVDQVFSIGKNTHNSLVSRDQGVADFHAEIINTQNKHVIANKTGQANVWINDQVVSEKQVVSSGDKIRIGSLELELVDPKETDIAESLTTHQQSDWAITSNASWLEQNRFSIQQRAVIGRDSTCDIQLPIEHLSRQHALLEVRNGQLYVKDLGSSNGTFLNGRKITESPVKTGDKLKFDVITFDIQGPEFDPNKTIIRPLEDKQGSASSAANVNKSKVTQKTEPHKKAKRKLAADGRQDWISNQENNLPAKKKNNSWVYLALAVSACIAVYFGVY